MREDFREILRLVRPGARVLDVGCGGGELLELLRDEKGCDGRGIEIGADGVAACLARGLPVMQGDADRDLGEFPPDSFDYAILSQTLQAVREPRKVLADLTRLAERAVVSFPNFGHWRVRLSLLASGRMPMTRALPDPWWSTPNIRLCTLRDFTDLAAELGLAVESATALARGRAARPMDPASPVEVLRAETALLLLRRAGG
jgi:methionine biosynthesis protein MetW